MKTSRHFLVFDQEEIGEPAYIHYQSFRPDDVEYYLGELDFLATVTDRIDLALIPISDPGGELEESGLIAFLERFHPDAIAFLDPSRREDLYPVVAEQIRALGHHPAFFLAQHPGDVFVLRR